MTSAGKAAIILLAIAVPATVVLVGSKSKTKAPIVPDLPKREPGKPTPLWAKFMPPAEVPAPIVGKVQPPPDTRLVGFFSRQNHWIRIDEYTNSIIEDEAGGALHTSMRYKAKFRWTILMGETDHPLAIDDVETEGTSWTLFDGPLYDPTTDLIKEARDEAVTAAVNLAVQWLFASGLATMFPE